MEEQLKLIQELRFEVNKLISERDDIKEKYNDLVTKLDNTFYDIQDMNKRLEEATNILNLLVENKACTLYSPFCIAVAGGMFIFLNIKTNVMTAGINVPWTIYLLTSITISIAVGLLVFLSGYVITKGFYDKIEKYLVKKYLHINKAYDKVNSLTNERNLKEQNLMNMKKDRDSLETSLKGIEEHLDRKREELYNAEEDYFNNLVGKPFISENGRHYTIGIIGKGKTKVRIPDFKENLEN